MDKIIRAMSKDGMNKISAVDGREMVTRAKEIHHTTPTATAALGRLLCAASLLGNMMKEEKASLTMRINGGGPLGGVLAVSDSNGNVRGYVGNPECDLPLRPDGKLDVGGAVGRDGMLTVSRDIGLKEPYIGSTEIVEEIPVEYRCTCSRARLEEALQTIDNSELQDIIRSGEDIHVNCQFCDTVYTFTPADVGEILAKKVAESAE